MTPSPTADETAAAELAASPRDTLLLPLLAPMSRLLIRMGGVEWEPKEEDALLADLALLDAEPDLAAPAALAAAMRAGRFALKAGGPLFDTLADGWLRRRNASGTPVADLLGTWLASAKAPLPVVAAVVAALGEGPRPAFGPSAKLPPHPVARVLFAYAGEAGAADWSAAYVMAAEYWADAWHRERLLADAWRLSIEEVQMMEEMVSDVEEELMEITDPAFMEEMAEVSTRRPHLRLVEDEAPPPADLLAGVVVVLFTGAPGENAREARVADLRRAGAEVYAAEGEAGPADPSLFQPGRVIVCDMAFVDGERRDEIRDRAQTARLTYVRFPPSAVNIVWAVAKRVGRAPPGR